MRRILLAMVCTPFGILAAHAATEDAAQTMQAHVQRLLPGAVTMAPIPDAPMPARDDADAGVPDANEADCLATAIYFEARGETTKGQRAVAEVILRRTRAPGRPGTVCGVVYEGSKRRTGCQFSFTCDGIADIVHDWRAWRRAKRVADWAVRMRGRAKPVVRGATCYHADSVMPYWAASMVKVAQIGSHIFYRP